MQFTLLNDVLQFDYQIIYIVLSFDVSTNILIKSMIYENDFFFNFYV